MKDYRDLYTEFCLKCKWCCACSDDDNSDCIEEYFEKCFEVDSKFTSTGINR